jgi:hypothetical protein
MAACCSSKVHVFTVPESRITGKSTSNFVTPFSVEEHHRVACETLIDELSTRLVPYLVWFVGNLLFCSHSGFR